MSNEQVLGEYLAIIKKSVDFVVKDLSHLGFKEDIVQDVFLKLYKGSFFEKYTLDDKEQSLVAASYIKRAVKSCYLDFLKKAKLTRSLTKKEREETDKKYEAIASADDIDDHASVESNQFISPEKILLAKQAYQVIKRCFEGALNNVSNQMKVHFLTEAFWEMDSYGLPIKKLAEVLGYENSNPTQDFNRFVSKVSDCTQPSGITLSKPNEAIEIIKQIIEIDGATA